MRLILPACYTLYVLIGFIGYGLLWRKLIRRQPLLDSPLSSRALDGAIGVALILFLGGIVNLLHPDVELLYLLLPAVGLTILLNEIVPHRETIRTRLEAAVAYVQRDQTLLLLIILTALLLGARWLGAVNVAAIGDDGHTLVPRFNPHDDFHSYLVLVQCLLHTGTLGNDPFNERAMVASLGGTYFLTAIPLTFFPLQCVNLIEQAAALTLFLALFAHLGRLVGASPRTIAALIVLLLLVHFDNANITAYWSVAALFLALVIMLLDAFRNAPTWRSTLTFAVLLAGACCLKSNIVPAAAILMGLYAILLFIRHRRVAILQLLLLASTTLVLLAPWMIGMFHSHGTLFYPLLGHGDHAPPLPDPSAWPHLTGMGTRALLIALIPSASALLFFAIEKMSIRALTTDERLFGIITAISAFIGSAAIGVATGGTSTWRYAFPATLVALCLSLLLLLIAIQRRPSPVSKTLPILWLIAVAVMTPFVWTLYYTEIPQNISAALANMPLARDLEIVRAHNLQLLIPEKEPILARLAYPFLLDFKRNPIYVADWPGDVGPATPRFLNGMPLDQGSEQLAAYIRDCNINYFAYSYTSEANFRHRIYGYLTDRSQGPWDRSIATRAFAFQSLALELGKHYPHLYDDGDTFVLDLTKPTP